MFDSKFFDDLAKKLSNLVPESIKPGLKSAQDDLEKNIHAALQSAFSKLDLVTREEFDVQAQVLLRTRLKLEDLEKQVVALEAIQKGGIDDDRG